MDITSLPISRWNILEASFDSKLSHIPQLSKYVCSKCIQKTTTSHRYHSGQSHCHHLSSSSHQLLSCNFVTLAPFQQPEFSCQNPEFCFRDGTEASHLKHSKTQSLYNGYHSPTWSSPILTVFPGHLFAFLPFWYVSASCSSWSLCPSLIGLLTAFLIPRSTWGTLY